MAEKEQIKINNKLYKPEFAVFADTQAEPSHVYKWLEFLKNEIKSFPIYVVTKSDLEKDCFQLSNKQNALRYNIPFFTLKPEGQKGIMIRKCTRDYKIRPILKFIKQKTQIRKYKISTKRKIDENIDLVKGNIKFDIDYSKKINQWIGISTDEAMRMKDSLEKWAINFYPLIEMNMSRNDCLIWMQNYKYPEPPRSACYFCPYHNDKEWINLKNNYPDEFQKAVEFEKDIQNKTINLGKLESIPYLHNKRINLNEIEFNIKDEANNFGNDCQGMCGN